MKIRYFVALVFALESVAVGQGPSGEVRQFVRVEAPVVVLEHVRVVDGTGAAPVEDQAVVIDQSGDEIDVLSSISDQRSFSNPGKELDRKVLGERIQAALSKLTPRERMVFELKHYQGLRLRTIGEMLNTTEETAKNTLFRATKKLRTQLAGLR